MIAYRYNLASLLDYANQTKSLISYSVTEGYVFQARLNLNSFRSMDLLMGLRIKVDARQSFNSLISAELINY